MGRSAFAGPSVGDDRREWNRETSVLDVLSLLASSGQGRLSSAISELSGLANVLTYDKAGELGLEITMEVPNYEPLEYSLWLRPRGVSHVIREETLSQVRGRHYSFT
jgi:predicted ATPase